MKKCTIIRTPTRNIGISETFDEIVPYMGRDQDVVLCLTEVIHAPSMAGENAVRRVALRVRDILEIHDYQTQYP